MAGFVFFDGFNDRKWLDEDGYSDGWGLYDAFYLGDGMWDFPDSYFGSFERGRYGGWCAMLAESDQSYNYMNIDHDPVPSGKNWCGGIAIESLDESARFFRGWFGTNYGPDIEFGSYGDVVIDEESGGSAGVTRSSKNNLMTMHGWHYVTFAFHAGDPGSDWIKIWVDGNKVVDVDSITLNNGALDRIEFPDTTNAFDDIWLRNDTNVILPEVRVLAIFPDAAGDDTDGTPLGSATNYENVNDFDVSFGTYNTVDSGEKDCFNCDAITAQISTGVVHAIDVRVFCYGDTGNTDLIRPYIKTGGNKYNGIAHLPTVGEWDYIHHIWEDNPNTGNPWTLAELDAVQIGYEVI
jgi:hypothetical protein